MKLNEAIADWWLRNARIKHGHPPTTEAVTVEQADAPTSGMGTAAKVALALVAGAGGLAAAQQLGWLPSDAPETTAATDPPATGDASLYQYLEDNGYHLP